VSEIVNNFEEEVDGEVIPGEFVGTMLEGLISGILQK